jgi:phosphoribosylanthranilate isomerase
MKIKVCGITSIEQMQQLKELGADYAGMIFYEGSKRFVGAIKNEKLKIKNVDIAKIGVFVNADFDTVTKAVDDYGLTAVQLHGDETDEFCLELMDKVKVIKVFRIADQNDIDDLILPFQNVCHYFLFDTDGPLQTSPGRGGLANTQPLLGQDASQNNLSSSSKVSADGGPSYREGSGMGLYGGTGKQFDWNILRSAKINKPFFLSGGIGLEDVEKLRSFNHPFCYAVDVNSRFETEPGMKDMNKVESFIKAVRHE